MIPVRRKLRTPVSLTSYPLLEPNQKQEPEKDEEKAGEDKQRAIKELSRSGLTKQRSLQ